MGAHVGVKGILIFSLLMAGTCVVAADAPPAGAAKSEYSRQFGYLPTRDGTRLAYVVYLPAAQGRFPTVLQYEPYLGGGSPPDKRWLFSDTADGAKASAVIYSLMLTCRACGVDPLAWLRHVLTELPQRTEAADIGDLLPINFSKNAS